MSYYQRIFMLFVIDTIIIILSILFAYWLRFEFKIPNEYIISAFYAFIFIWIITFPTYYYLKLYKRVWQYASIGELISIIKATTISIIVSLAFYLILKSLGWEIVIPRSIFLISWMTIILGIGGSRFVWRIFRDNYIKIEPHHKRALIFGAGNAGALVAKELKHTPDTDLYPVAFVDDDPSKLFLEVVGLPVIGNRYDIVERVKSYNIDTIIIAIPSAPREEIAKVIDLCKETGAKIKLLPRVSDVVHGKVSVQLIRDVNVEDLLGREPVEVDLNQIAGYVKDKVVLVTGAGGSIGSELCRQIAPFKPEKLLLLGHGENSIYQIELELVKSFPDIQYETIIADIQDRERIEQVFDLYRPHVIFHAAAHKHVPLMERNPAEAVKNNVIGTKNVAECADQFEATHFVMISTDKAVNPTSVMGATKRVAEMIIQSMAKGSNTKFVAVRFGNVLGSRGSVVPIFKKQIEQGGPVTVTHPDMVRYFMTIPEAVQLVIQAGALAEGGEIFILDMGQPVRIADLAKDLIRLSGLRPDQDVKIVYTGIRPGEKLYEELLTDEEGTRETKHDRIFIGKPITFEEKNFYVNLMELEKTVTQTIYLSKFKIKEQLKRIVPSYQVGPSDQNISKKLHAEFEIKEAHSQTVASFKED
ncbi:MAG: polysaccharide biosynthesis protein [Bacillaceae bacterium]|nr:polysaccharide biosynthesis protein [Bacillaceae bacterium]